MDCCSDQIDPASRQFFGLMGVVNVVCHNAGMRRARRCRGCRAAAVVAWMLWVFVTTFAGPARAGLSDPSSDPSGGTGGPGGFWIDRQTVWVDRAHRRAHFRLEFSRKPDFFRLDAAGRQMDGFDFFVNPDWSGDPRRLDLDFGQFRDVIRGEEIHVAGRIPVRDAVASGDFGPQAGGWGRELASIPFRATGRTVEFQIPWQALRETDGAFSYSLFSTDAGTQTSSFTGTSVPLPPAVWPALATLGAGLAGMAARRLRRRR
jgi:hypothetical protein